MFRALRNSSPKYVFTDRMTAQHDLTKVTPFVTSETGKEVVPIRISGDVLKTDTTKLISVVSSSKGCEVHLAQGATPEVAREAASSSWKAFEKWKHVPYPERRDLLLKAADNIQKWEAAFVAMQMRETSCSEEWAHFNVGLAAEIVREIASNISTECTGELPALRNPGAFCMVFRDPVGPVLAIEPWNASMILSSRALAAPLGAGCTVVFKASELCPGVHHLISMAFIEAGFPRGCINVLQAARQDSIEVTEALISHPAIRKIAFTGSARVGAAVGQMASKYLKPVLMELGGKAPAVVLKDADLEQAAALCAKGAFIHHGQICMSTERIIAVRDIADQFAEILTRQIRQDYTKGAGFAVSAGVAQRAHELVADAVNQGAGLLVGDNKFTDQHKAALTPTVITNLRPEHKIYTEETFGPSVSFFVVENEDEAVKLANQSRYGLNAAVHSRDVLAALRVARQIECGQVHIGSITEYDEANAPIGGTKQSGWGRNNGKYALREFLVEKTISIHDPCTGVSFGRGV